MNELNGAEELERLGRELVSRFRELKAVIGAQRTAVDSRDFVELSVLVTEREKVQKEVDSIRSRLDELAAGRPELRRARPAVLVEAAALLDELVEADETVVRAFHATMGEAGEQLQGLREMQRLARVYRKGLGWFSQGGKLLDEVK